MRRFAHIVFMIVLVAAGLSAQGVGPTSAQTNPPSPLQRAGGALFIENVGQFAEGARFQMWGGVGATWLAEDGVWITLVEPATHTVGLHASPGPGPRGPEDEELTQAPRRAVNVKLSFVGANPHPKLEPYGRAETKVSYFIGADADKWHADVPVWSGVRYVDLYPGIDLLVGATDPFAREGQTQDSSLPWRLEAQEGAALENVRLRIEGADAVTLEDVGLRLRTAVGEPRLPLVYLVGGPDVQGGALAAQPAGPAAFEVQAPFTAQRPARARLHDQPSDLLYATFLGGTNYDIGYGIAVDGAGCAYVTGGTSSWDFPAALGSGYDTR